MKELTTPKAILIGFFMVAVSIASLPYEGVLVKQAHAELSGSDLWGIEKKLSSIETALLSIADAIRYK
jgi:hypothetical protein